MKRFEKLFRREDGRAWVGECAQDAVLVAEVPAPDDSRWIKGRPTVLDTQVLTLSPFSPSGRLGVTVECQRSDGPRYPNHPAFFGCRAWMPLDAIVWQPQLPDAPAPSSPKMR